MPSVRWGVRVTYRGLHGTVGVRKLRAAIRDAMKAAGYTWWKRYLPERFKFGNAEKFNMYSKRIEYRRKANYEDFKKKLEGRKISRWKNIPIVPFYVARNQPRKYVLSGQTALTAISRVTLSGTYKKVKVSFPVPSYFLRSEDAQERRADLLRLTPSEMKTVAQIVDRFIQRAINADRSTTQTNISE